MKTTKHFPRVLTLFVLGAAMFALSIAYAQDAVPAPTPVASVAAEPQQPQTFTGMIAKTQDGRYVLQDASTVYVLSDQDSAKKFEGKKVTVTGTLDQNSKTISVSKIEAAS